VSQYVHPTTQPVNRTNAQDVPVHVDSPWMLLNISVTTSVFSASRPASLLPTAPAPFPIILPECRRLWQENGGPESPGNTSKSRLNSRVMILEDTWRWFEYGLDGSRKKRYVNIGTVSGPGHD